MPVQGCVGRVVWGIAMLHHILHILRVLLNIWGGMRSNNSMRTDKQLHRRSVVQQGSVTGSVSQQKEDSLNYISPLALPCDGIPVQSRTKSCRRLLATNATFRRRFVGKHARTTKFRNIERISWPNWKSSGECFQSSRPLISKCSANIYLYL